MGGAICDVSNFVGARIGGAVDGPRDRDGGLVVEVVVLLLIREGFPSGKVGELRGGRGGARGGIRGREGGGGSSGCGEVRG